MCFSLIGSDVQIPPQGERRGWSCWAQMTRPTFRVVPKNHQHSEIGQRHTAVPKASGYNFSCWLLQSSKLSFAQGSTCNQLDKNCFPAVSHSLPVHIPDCWRFPEGGKRLHPKMLMDHATELVLEPLLERPFCHVEKVLLLLMRTVKPAWHQDKEKLPYAGY